MGNSEHQGKAKTHAEAVRSGGGPGSSHQGGGHGHAHREAGHTVDEGDPDHRGPTPDAPTNTAKSKVSGGGGERDSHHSADPTRKGDRSGD